MTTPTLRSPVTLRPASMLGILLAILAIPAALPLFGCDTGVLGAQTTIGVMRRAAPSAGRGRDPDLAESSLPASIGQMEGLLELVPADLNLRVLMARSYSSFGFGFMEEHLEATEFAGGSEEDIEHWRQRANAAYLRAREVSLGGLDYVHGENGGIAAAQTHGLEGFTAHIAQFDNPERDAPLLFWAAYSWARWIGLNRDNVAALADLPLVNVLADRAAALDPTFMDHGPVALRAGLMGSAPEQLGGRPRDAQVEFERVIELTHRQNLLYLVTEARICAIAIQDRALYQRLLEEVLAFDVDTLPDQRLANLLAQRRARRYLAEIDNFFEPEGTVDEPEAESGDTASAE